MFSSSESNHASGSPPARVAKRAVPTGAVVALLLLCFAGVAFGAFHTIGTVYHGLGSSNGGGLGSGNPLARALNIDCCQGVQVIAGVYHLRDDGGWNTQCVTPFQLNIAECQGTWGSAPCRKYAWTQAINQYAWHPHGSTACV